MRDRETVSMTSGISLNSLGIDERNIPLLRRWQRRWRWEEFLRHVYYKYCAPMELSLAGIPLETAKNLNFLGAEIPRTALSESPGLGYIYVTPMEFQFVLKNRFPVFCGKVKSPGHFDLTVVIVCGYHLRSRF